MFSYIYGLCCPDSKQVYYIGKSIDPKDRYKSHFYPCNLKYSTLKNNWIKSLLKKGKKPELIIIKKCTNKNVDYYEIFYIKKYRKINPQLKNGTDGGDGGDTSHGEIVCSNGKIYKTIKEASKDTKIGNQIIQLVLDGEKNDYNGLSFKRTISKRVIESSRKTKKIKCSNGMVFKCCREAATFLKTEFKISSPILYISSNIRSCALGRQKTVKGLQFWYEGDKQPIIKDQSESTMKPIGCSNGKKYKSLSHAGRELNIDFRLISQVLRKKQKTTHGLKFWFLRKKDRIY